MGHAHLVVHLPHNDPPASRDLPGGQDGEHGSVPFLHAGQEIRVQIAGQVLDLFVLADKGGLWVASEQPRRNALVNRLRHDVRPWARDDQKAHVGREVEEPGQIAHRMAVAVEVGHALVKLVPEPGDVGSDGIQAGLFQQAQPVGPLVLWRAEIMELPASIRLTVEPKMSIFYREAIQDVSPLTIPSRSAGC